MSDYLSPRRFARVMEMDRNGPDACGTLEDQAKVRDALEQYIEFDNGFDRVLFALDKKVNQWGRSFLWWTFVYEEVANNRRAFAYHIVIQLFVANGAPWNDAVWEDTVLHELGHWIGMWLLEPPDRSEFRANQFKWWVQQGCPDTWPVFEALDAVGAQDSVV